MAQAGEQYAYDSAGNLTRDRDGQTYVFDGENKMVSLMAEHRKVALTMAMTAMGDV